MEDASRRHGRALDYAAEGSAGVAGRNDDAAFGFARAAVWRLREVIALGILFLCALAWVAWSVFTAPQGEETADGFIAAKLPSKPTLLSRLRIHPIVGFEEFPPRVHFNDFNAESLNIVVFYWYAPVDWWAYMQHSERVNYRIMEEFERLGVEFAFPTQTIYLKNQAIGAAASDATFHDKRNKSSAA
jgi:small-conductance mechanosensitive channel